MGDLIDYVKADPNLEGLAPYVDDMRQVIAGIIARVNELAASGVLPVADVYDLWRPGVIAGILGTMTLEDVEALAWKLFDKGKQIVWHDLLYPKETP